MANKYKYLYSCASMPMLVARTLFSIAICWADGIKMFMSELLTQEQLQEIVLQKLAARVELDGPAFDKWLEVPAVV